MVKLHCTVPSDPFPFLSLDGLHFFSFWAVWLPAPGAVVPDAWLGSTPPTNSPYTQGLDVLLVMFFQYTVILPDSQALLQSHHLHILYLLLPLSNSTLIFSLLTSITVSHQLSLQNNFTSAAMLPHPIFFPFRNCGFPLISWYSNFIVYSQDAFQLYPTFLCIYHSPCMQFPISCSSWTVCLLISMIFS